MRSYFGHFFMRLALIYVSSTLAVSAQENSFPMEIGAVPAGSYAVGNMQCGPGLRLTKQECWRLRFDLGLFLGCDKIMDQAVGHDWRIIKDRRDLNLAVRNFYGCLENRLGYFSVLRRHKNASPETVGKALLEFHDAIQASEDGQPHVNPELVGMRRFDGSKGFSASSNIHGHIALCPPNPEIRLEFAPQENGSDWQPARIRQIVPGPYKVLQKRELSSNSCLRDTVRYSVFVDGNEAFSETFKYINQDMEAFMVVAGDEVSAFFEAYYANGGVVKEPVASPETAAMSEAKETRAAACVVASNETINKTIKAVSGIGFSDPEYEETAWYTKKRLPQDHTVQSVSEGLIIDEFGIKPGDEFVIVGRYPGIFGGMLFSFCDGVTKLAVIKRGDQYFELVLSQNSIKELVPGAFDLEVANPFGPQSPKAFYSPGWSLVFEGDFSKFDANERGQLIVIASSAITNGAYSDVDYYQQDKYPTGSPCFPYGATSTTYEQYRTLDGTPISKANEWTLLHDPRLQKTVRRHYEDVQWRLDTNKPIQNLINEYGCFSPEYRYFYDRLFHLAE